VQARIGEARAQTTARPQTDAQVRAAGSLGATPLVVLSASTPADEKRRALNALHAELAALSSRATHRVVEGATHTSVVASREHARETGAAIGRVVEAARAAQPPTR
jgi:hypothetical protein